MSEFVEALPDWYKAVGGVLGLITFTVIFVGNLKSSRSGALVMVWVAILGAGLVSILWPLIAFIALVLGGLLAFKGNREVPNRLEDPKVRQVVRPGKVPISTAGPSRYTASMEAKLRAAAPLNFGKAAELIEDPEFAEAGVTVRGIAAKARAMGIKYDSDAVS